MTRVVSFVLKAGTKNTRRSVNVCNVQMDCQRLELGHQMQVNAEVIIKCK